MKSYEIKSYQADGTFIGTMDRTIVISDINFSASINAGQGDCEIDLDLPFDSVEFPQGDFIKVLCFDDYVPDGRVIFTGQISRVQRTYTAGIEKIKLTCLGLASLINDLYFQSGASYVFNKNQPAGQTVSEIVAYFNTVYTGGWIVDDGSIQTGPTVNISFNYTKCIDAIKKCAEVSGYFFAIHPDGSVHFFSDSPTGIEHCPVLQRDIQSLTVNEDAETIVNRYILTWSSGTVTVNDATSQTQYWIKELRETDTTILDVWTANTKANAYIAKWKDPRQKVSLILNPGYSFNDNTIWDDTNTWNDADIWNDFAWKWGIEDVSPGEVITVRNSDYVMSALRIAKTDYNPEELRIDLEVADTFAKEILTL